jgi:adenylate kinase
MSGRLIRPNHRRVPRILKVVMSEWPQNFFMNETHLKLLETSNEEASALSELPWSSSENPDAGFLVDEAEIEGYPAVRVTCEIPIPAEQVLSELLNIEQRTQWDYNFLEGSAVLMHDEKNDIDLVHQLGSEGMAGVISPRDYVYLRKVFRESSFTRILCVTPEIDNVPFLSNSIRGVVILRFWDITPLNDTATKVAEVICLNQKGFVPKEVTRQSLVNESTVSYTSFLEYLVSLKNPSCPFHHTLRRHSIHEPWELATCDKCKSEFEAEDFQTIYSCDACDFDLCVECALQQPSAPTPLRVVICGPPASGRSTQARHIAKTFSATHLTSSGILKAALASSSCPYGAEIAAALRASQMVPNNIMAQLIHDALKAETGGWVLEGYPQTVLQARDFGTILAKLDVVLAAVIRFEVCSEQLLERISDRKGSEDNEATLNFRLGVYRQEFKQVEDYFANQGLLVTIDGSGGISEVSDRTIASLNASLLFLKASRSVKSTTV